MANESRFSFNARQKKHAGVVFEEMAVVLSEKFLEVNAALEEANGDHAAAAAALGVEPIELRRMINLCPELKLRWVSNATHTTCPPKPIIPPSQEESLAGDLLDGDGRGYNGSPNAPDLDAQQVELQRIIHSDNERIRRSLEALGLTEREIKLAYDLQDFNRNHFNSLIDITTAALARLSIKMIFPVDATFERLATVRRKIAELGDTMTEDREAWVREESSIVRDLRSLGDLVTKTTDSVYESSKTIAWIRFHKKNTKKVKPAFGTEEKASQMEVEV